MPTPARRAAQAMLEARLNRHGFFLEHTGGNCTAYISREGGFETWLSTGDCLAPVRLAQKVWIWEGELATGAEGDSVRAYRMVDVLAALDNPKTEYCSLSLRLENDYLLLRGEARFMKM